MENIEESKTKEQQIKPKENKNTDKSFQINYNYGELAMNYQKKDFLEMALNRIGNVFFILASLFLILEISGTIGAIFWVVGMVGILVFGLVAVVFSGGLIFTTDWFVPFMQNGISFMFGDATEVFAKFKNYVPLFAGLGLACSILCIVAMAFTLNKRINIFKLGLSICYVALLIIFLIMGIGITTA